MPRLKKLENIVLNILKDDELSRIDDCYLILRVIGKLYPNEIGKNFATVMFNAKNKGISFESITRCRRKIQMKHPEFRNEDIERKRRKKQKEYIEYSKQS